MVHKLKYSYVGIDGELYQKHFYIDELIEFKYEFVDYDPIELLVDQEVEKILKGEDPDSIREKKA